MRRFHAALVAAVAVIVLAGFAPPASADNVTYAEPVIGRVTDRFRPPATPYGRGNRGLTYATDPGAAARASAPGRVTFAGQVGGALHVVVRHADGVRTSYSFLKSVDVRTGQVVDQGDRVGATADTFHFGARIGDAYIDPAILLASGPARVHLIPDGEFREEGADRDENALFAAVADRIGSVASSAVDWARGAAVEAASEVVDGAEAQLRFVASHAVTVLDQIVDLGEFAGPFAALAAAFADILDAFLEACTSPDLAPPPRSGRHIAVFVAGLGSKSGGPGAGNNLSRRFADLGYTPIDTFDFSYRGGRHPEAYDAADTVRDLRADAADLRELLDQIAVDHPGVPVDLIAHSQGGLVAREALADRYDGVDHTLPPIAHVVTIGTPHHGTDSATANAWLRWTAGGRAIRALAREFHTSFDLTGPGVAQLAETSDFIRDINNRPLRAGVKYTSIAAAADMVVPAPRSRLRNATNVLVDVGSLTESHSALTEAPASHREIALALADSPPTCQSIATTARRAFTGAGVATVEDGVGKAATALSGRIP